MFFMFFLFFTMGMWYAQQDCQDNCNMFIQENYIDKLGDELIYNSMSEKAKSFPKLNFSVNIPET